jgi:hypothetical protein
MKMDAKHGTIVLSRTDTRRWADTGPDGYALRRDVRDMAKRLANRRNAAVQVYASASAGGWTADLIQPTV